MTFHSSFPLYSLNHYDYSRTNLTLFPTYGASFFSSSSHNIHFRCVFHFPQAWFFFCNRYFRARENIKPKIITSIGVHFTFFRLGLEPAGSAYPRSSHSPTVGGGAAGVRDRELLQFEDEEDWLFSPSLLASLAEE